jgi:hypothetical protein
MLYWVDVDNLENVWVANVRVRSEFTEFDNLLPPSPKGELWKSDSGKVLISKINLRMRIDYKTFIRLPLIKLVVCHSERSEESMGTSSEKVVISKS